MRVFFVSLLQRLVFASLLGLAATASAQAKPDPNGPPDQFVLAAANEALDVLKADGAVKAGNTARINQVVNDHILPYVDFQKTRGWPPAATGARPTNNSARIWPRLSAAPWCAPTAAR